MRYSAITNVGNVRELNEDEFFVDTEFQRLFMVADGMGGHNAGDVASKMAINILKNYYFENIKENNNIEDIKQELLKGIELSNKSIINASKKFDKLKDMGTTLNLVYINDKDIIFINIGDSRAYVGTEEIFKQVTVDHSLVEELIENGEITEEESYNHPQKNIITSCLGAKGDYKVDVYRLKKEKNMKLLLCTDGLTNLVSKSEIEEIINENEIENATKLLIHSAKENGGFDNITLILIDLDETRVLNE
ncbi:MAG: Stp1/IreP family PP2C-type Ser/Thr phosphatase [Bacillota bacterium]|nr:Stp1/IreP family PP2C-type Ser/Thr phosphatase [Bacillota bacterium]